MINPREVWFSKLADIDVRYDRDPDAYGTAGRAYRFYCRRRLKEALNNCFEDLFDVWGLGIPLFILSAGTIGDGENAHGRGMAFDLDGFIFHDKKLLMNGFKQHPYEYLGINAHLFLYFSQVLSHHYPEHHDHFHVDFNRRYYRYVTQSNAQTFFVQSVLKYMFDYDLGTSGQDNDGIDGVYGYLTKTALKSALQSLSINHPDGIEKT